MHDDMTHYRSATGRYRSASAIGHLGEMMEAIASMPRAEMREGHLLDLYRALDDASSRRPWRIHAWGKDMWRALEVLLQRRTNEDVLQMREVQRRLLPLLVDAAFRCKVPAADRADILDLIPSELLASWAIKCEEIASELGTGMHVIRLASRAPVDGSEEHIDPWEYCAAASITFCTLSGGDIHLANIDIGIDRINTVHDWFHPQESGIWLWVQADLRHMNHIEWHDRPSQWLAPPHGCILVPRGQPIAAENLDRILAGEHGGAWQNIGTRRVKTLTARPLEEEPFSWDDYMERRRRRGIEYNAVILEESPASKVIREEMGDVTENVAGAIQEAAIDAFGDIGIKIRGGADTSPMSPYGIAAHIKGKMTATGFEEAYELAPAGVSREEFRRAMREHGITFQNSEDGGEAYEREPMPFEPTEISPTPWVRVTDGPHMGEITGGIRLDKGGDI